MLKRSQVEIGPVGGQCTDYQEVGVYGTHKVKIQIHVDSYKSQGRAHVSVWSPSELKWNLVHSLNPLLMATNKDLGYRNIPATQADFAVDRKRLLDYVKQILE